MSADASPIEAVGAWRLFGIRLTCRRGLAVLLIALLSGMAACGDTDAEGGGADRGGADGEGAAFGPMAVISMDPPAIRHQVLGGTGAVEMSDHCVTMTPPSGDKLLLVWREGDVRWEAALRTIDFNSGSVTDEALSITDGDVITVGGRPLVLDGSPVEVKWLVNPHADCVGTPWDVSSVSAPPDVE